MNPKTKEVLERLEVIIPKLCINSGLKSKKFRTALQDAISLISRYEQFTVERIEKILEPHTKAITLNIFSRILWQQSDTRVIAQAICKELKNE